MPIDRSRYSQDWDLISLRIRESVKWTCQSCGRPCRKAGEDLTSFAERVEGIFHPDLDWANQTAHLTIAHHPQRFTLTVAHLDQNSLNNDPGNLRALCAPCHLNHDRPYQMHNRYRKRERKGQLRLPLGV
jgi:5-methylcytosine-specific restriction endonuclease McrA